MTVNNSAAWLGVDPGGEGKFGVAVLPAKGKPRSASLDCVDDVLEFVRREVTGALLGVGIDSPLWWSSGKAGLRVADSWIRETHELPNRNVQAVNSMWGAVLAQGMLFASRVRERFPDVPITEVHPKALLVALGREQWLRHFSSVTTDVGLEEDADGRRDALIAAIAAREGFSGHWKRDLSLDRSPSEQDPSRHWIGPVHYFWPV